MAEKERDMLLPCPFCGGTNVAERADDGYVSCADCYAYGPETGTKGWNTRASSPQEGNGPE